MLWTVVSITHSETHIIQGEKKQISRLSPHPSRLFYFILGQQTAILFSRNAWRIAFQFCVALLPPWTMVQTPRQLQSAQEGTGAVHSLQEAQGQENTGQRDKTPLKCKICQCLTCSCLGFFICELIFRSHFSPSTLQFLSTVNLSFFFGLYNLF